MTERLCVIEQPSELRIAHPNAVQWEAVDAIPGQVAVTPSELLAAALRHRPDRIIMGEIRNECGYDLLQAMNTGPWWNGSPPSTRAVPLTHSEGLPTLP